MCGTASHTWSKQGTYIIKAKASDGQAESEWATLEITMPTNQLLHTLFLHQIFKQVQNTISLLKQLLEF